jgi:ArsR family transcriptional regulator, arsenate/arsenite/antimonite-responsive transcriptional repressor
MEATKEIALELSEDQIHLIAKALADPRRLDILRQIGSCPGQIGCGTILENNPITAATLSHHMKELETAGLVRGTKDGKFVHYALRRDVLQAYTDQLAKI